MWEITLYWYLEWINQILTDAVAQLDALDSPEIWFDDVAGNYLSSGVPDDLSLPEKLQFTNVVNATILHLEATPATLSSERVESFRDLLVDMRAEI